MISDQNQSTAKTHAPVAVITAGGRGMGAAIARELHARGYRLALMSPSGNAESLAAELGGIGVRGSTEDAGDLKRLIDSTKGAFGRIDAVMLEHIEQAVMAGRDERRRHFLADEILEGFHRVSDCRRIARSI